MLTYARGFEFEPLEEVQFDNFGEFGLQGLFPNSITLAGDGFGNHWVLDLDSKGNWKDVYYVCHDPAVVVKHSKNLSQFIAHVDEFGSKLSNSHLDRVHEEIVMDIWRESSSSDQTVDLNSTPIGSGFAWGKSGANVKIVRIGDEAIWTIEKQQRQGFLSGLMAKFLNNEYTIQQQATNSAIGKKQTSSAPLPTAIPKCTRKQN